LAVAAVLALLTALQPAQRASRTDPMTVLRRE
jgi:ABC-type lipoprotein release transport system permease subunit